MRVVMISHNYYPLLGGAERQIGSLAPLLQARGIELHILTRRYPGLAAEEIVQGVPVHRIPAPRVAPSPVFTLLALPQIRRLKPDVIHAFSLFSPLTTAVMAKLLFNTPVVVKLLRGGTLGDMIRLQNKRFGQPRLKFFTDKVDRFISISTEITAEMTGAGIPAEKQVFIPNGVDMARFSPCDPAEKLRRRRSLNLPEKGQLAIYTGRLVPEKSIDVLLRAWQHIQAQFPEAHLLIAGEGPEETHLREMAGAGVHWIGYAEDVAPYLQAADLFVLPSVSEGLSNALLEAMAAGLACVVTPVGGAPDLIQQGKNGWFIEPRSESALESAFSTLLPDQALQVALGQAARDVIASGYSLESTADRLAALYQEVAP